MEPTKKIILSSLFTLLRVKIHYLHYVGTKKNIILVRISFYRLLNRVSTVPQTAAAMDSIIESDALRTLVLYTPDNSEKKEVPNFLVNLRTKFSCKFSIFSIHGLAI